jgi:hypothetical protein
MARGIVHLGKSKKHPVEPCEPAQSRPADILSLQLQVAKEILAEVFGITLDEVEEMIRLRREEQVLWPERFWLGADDS